MTRRIRTLRIATILLVSAALAAPGGCGSDPTTPARNDMDLDRLPPDTGGTQTALPRDPGSPGAAPYGLHMYLPGGMDASPVPYPLLVFLHGSGERGDSAADPAVLATVLRNGPPRLIDRDQWHPPHPMIVVSPQCHGGSWDAALVRELIAWVDAHHPVDRTRIYLTGLSMGGYGTWSYLGRYGDAGDDSLAVAAAVPICGGGSTGLAAAISGTPVWAFHGTADTVVQPFASAALVKAIGALDPPVAPRLTLYDGVGHDSWSRTYDLSGLGQGMTAYPEDPAVGPWLVDYAPDVYTWLFSHRR